MYDDGIYLLYDQNYIVLTDQKTFGKENILKKRKSQSIENKNTIDIHLMLQKNEYEKLSVIQLSEIYIKRNVC